MNNNTAKIDTDYLCFVLPIMCVLFMFVLFVTSNRCIENFTNCVDPNSIVLGDNICYSCPIGATLNNKCKDSNIKPLQCMDPNAKLVNDICYGCPSGEIYDVTQKKCTSASTTTTTTVASTEATSKISYKCLNDDDILVGKSCYDCRGKNSKVNSSTLQCESVLNSYLPIDSYSLPTTDTSCKKGFFKDFGTCQKCNTDDSYKSGYGCMNLRISPPLNVIPAVKDSHPFDPYNFH